MNHNDSTDPHFHQQSRQLYHHMPLVPPSTIHQSSNGWASLPPLPESSTQSKKGTIPLSKLTPSCSRCRSKKLKCQFPESNPHAACTNCSNKGIGDECHRDVRIARGKRRRESNQDGGVKKSESSDGFRLGPPSTMNRQMEMAALRKRLEELEKLEQASNRKPLSPASTAEDAFQSASTPTGSHLSEDVGSSSIKVKKRKDVEDAAVMLEGLVAHGGSRKAYPHDADSTALPRDEVQENWRNSTTLSERLRLLRQVKLCPYASDEVVVRELVSVYLYRVNHLAGHVIYGPGFQRAVETFFTMTVEEIVTSKIFIDPCCLSTMMLVLCLGFEFHPRHVPPGRPATPGFLAVQSIRQRSIDPTQEWYSIARRALSIEDSYRLNSIPALQAACLFLVRGKESRGWSRMLHQVAISSAQDFGLHRLGEAKGKPSMELDDFIRLECGVRIWNFLAMRDGILASDQGYTLIIQPEQTTTRKPLNIDDEDMESGIQTPKPKDEWTMMSFVITQIELSEVIRESVILRNQLFQIRGGTSGGSIERASSPEEEEQRRNRFSLAHRSLLKHKLNDFILSMPEYFTLDSQVNTPGLIHVQRWLINQQIFDLQLRLIRCDLTSSDGRKDCLELANHIITHQANIRNICPVIDSLQVNFFHLFGACMVVLLDLIDHQNNHFEVHDSEFASHRDRSRGKVLEAMKSFHGVTNNSRGVRVLEVLLEHEDECFAGKMRRAGSGQHTSPGNNDTLSNLAKRLVNEIRAGSKGRDYKEERQEWPALLSKRTTVPSIPDQTLLPTAGAWRAGSFADNHTSLPLQEIEQIMEQGPNLRDDAFKAIGPYHRQMEAQAPPLYQSISSDSGSVFDWALGLGFDPFEGLHQQLAAPVVKVPHDTFDGPHQYTHERYLQELDNFNPIRIERARRQQLLFGNSQGQCIQTMSSS